MATLDSSSRRKATCVDGCKPSLYGGNIITSTGNSALDTIIGETMLTRAANISLKFIKLLFQAVAFQWVPSF